MHNLKTNFDKLYQIVKSSLSDKLDTQDNLQHYPRLPKMNDCSIIALSICQESLGIDSENYLWSKLINDYRDDFPMLIDRSNFNRRRRRLRMFVHEVTKKLSGNLTEEENIFIVDSIPVPVCKLAREKRCRFGRQSFETSPDKGYSAVSKSYYYGYKLHLVTSVTGVFYCMDLSKASVHDVSYLNDIKENGMKNATLIGDKGYLSKQIQLDLFHSSNVKLQTPKRRNQKQESEWHPIFRKSRKRSDTIGLKHCFLNYAIK